MVGREGGVAGLSRRGYQADQAGLPARAFRVGGPRTWTCELAQPGLVDREGGPAGSRSPGWWLEKVDLLARAVRAAGSRRWTCWPVQSAPLARGGGVGGSREWTCCRVRPGLLGRRGGAASPRSPGWWVEKVDPRARAAPPARFGRRVVWCQKVGRLDDAALPSAACNAVSEGVTLAASAADVWDRVCLDPSRWRGATGVPSSFSASLPRRRSS
jgi:hypothetical protein